MPLLQVSPAGHGDDKATFLAEFCALRHRAGLDYEELAARAHFPTDVLKDAERGPGLPGLPVLAAYVRACGGDVTEWEERWRRLASAAGYDSGLPVRPAGESPAAVAGARAGVMVSPAEAHDADRIRAALRAHREREDQASTSPQTGFSDTMTGFSDDMGYPQSSVADPATTTTLANGNHHKSTGLKAFDSPAAPATGFPASSPAATTRARQSGGNPGLLAVLIVLVLIGCIALLTLS